MAMGPRAGLRIAPKIGPAIGLGAFAIGGGYIGQGNPNKAWLQIGQSNNLGLGVAVNIAAAGFAGIDSPNSDVQFYRRGASAGNPPSWVVEAAEDLQARSSNFGSYASGTCGIELVLGRDLFAGDPLFAFGAGIGIDGSGWQDEWNNSAYPTGGPTMLTRVALDLATLLVTWDAHLELVVPIFGEADGAESPDFTNFKANMLSWLGGLKALFGPFKTVVPLLHWHAGSHDNIGVINRQVMEFCQAFGNADFVRMSERSFRDGVHYADTNGYGEFGVDVAAKYFFLDGGSVRTAPWIAVTGDPVVATSGQGLTVTVPAHRTNDVIVIELASSGLTAYATPTGTGGTWAAFPESPQQDSGSGLNSRYQGSWIRASTDNGVGTATIPDVGGDGSKTAIAYVVRGCRTSGNPFCDSQGDTAATGTAVTCPAVDTTGFANCLVVNTVCGQIDSVDAQVTAWANADLTDLHEEIDSWTNSGTGFGLGVASGIKATAGAVAGTTATLGTTTTQARHSKAFVPA